MSVDQDPTIVDPREQAASDWDAKQKELNLQKEFERIDNIEDENEKQREADDLFDKVTIEQPNSALAAQVYDKYLANLDGLNSNSRAEWVAKIAKDEGNFDEAKEYAEKMFTNREIIDYFKEVGERPDPILKTREQMLRDIEAAAQQK